MSIVSQQVDETGIHIKTPNTEVHITPEEITGYADRQLGSRDEKRLTTRSYMKDKIVMTLGEDQVSYEQIDIDYDEVKGTPTLLSISNQ